LISEKANARMRAALHAIRPGEPALPPDLAALVPSRPDREFRGDDLAELLGLSMVYARACLAVDSSVTALFAISEPHDGVVPVTTSVTFQGTPAGFEDDPRPLLVLSNEPAEYLYSCNEEQRRVMAETAAALEGLGLTRQAALARVNEFWGDRNRRYSLLYGGWIGQQDGAAWARAMPGSAEVIIDG
jgi:hypothetical protein